MNRALALVLPMRGYQNHPWESACQRKASTAPALTCHGSAAPSSVSGGPRASGTSKVVLPHLPESLCQTRHSPAPNRHVWGVEGGSKWSSRISFHGALQEGCFCWVELPLQYVVAVATVAWEGKPSLHLPPHLLKWLAPTPSPGA